jgi:hypothetical protein
MGIRYHSLGAYSLPWLVSPGKFNPTPMTWLSEQLHPAVRSQPALLTTFSLRLPLLLIGILVAMAFILVDAGLCVLVHIRVAALQTFFASNLDDPNYRQQFFLQVLRVVSLISFSKRFQTQRHAYGLLRPSVYLPPVCQGW